MVKVSGSANYKMAEVDRLLDLVEEYLPLGKDEGERGAAFYNSTRSRGWPERDFESLRRKFKVLYSTRKPTGTPEMPPHIKRAKELKEAIDEKANVVVMDDGADEDDREVEPDFCFNVDPDDVSDQVVGLVNRSSLSEDLSTQAQGSTGSAETFGAGANSSTVGQFQDLLASNLTNEDHASYPCTPFTTTLVRASRSTRATTRKSSASAKTGVAQPQTPQPPVRLRSDLGESKVQKYQNSSNRLGGAGLATLRETVGMKRNFDGDKDLLEASFAKAKRIRAIKTTTALKTKLASIETSSLSMGNNMMETIMLLREENERKAETRRAEEDLRRRDELAAREARFLADKAEAEERRRQDKLDMEERSRRDKEDARVRTQELLLLIGTLTKRM
jgi:hypothetical protein